MESQNEFEILDETGQYSEEGYDSMGEEFNFGKKDNSKLCSNTKNDSMVKSRVGSSGVGKVEKGGEDSNLFGISDNLEDESFTVSQGTKNINGIFKNRLHTGKRETGGGKVYGGEEGEGEGEGDWGELYDSNQIYDDSGIGSDLGRY